MSNEKNKFYPAKRGNVFINKDGAWKPHLLKLTNRIDKDLDKLILELHDIKYTIEEISYILNTCVSTAIYKYSMLGKVVTINKKNK